MRIRNAYEKIAYLLVFFTFLLFSFKSNAQVITTICGTGASGFTGDGGLATAAQMTQTWGLARDASGNIYFSDYQNHRIRKVDPSGIITTFAGNGTASFSGDGGPAISAGLGYPTDIAIYGTDVYVGENSLSRVRKINAAGIISTVAGNGTSGSSGDGGPATAASIDQPNGICVDNVGNLYICDQTTHRIRKVSTTGIITTIAGTGSYGYTGDGGLAVSATMTLPDHVVTDAAGNVYFADYYNSVVRKVTVSTGIITTFAGTGVAGFSGDGGLATAAKLNNPGGLAFDAAGNFYIADEHNHKIRKITPAGIISTIAGTGTAGYSGDGGNPLLAKINNANEVCADATGNVYIGDMLNLRIRKITYVANYPPVFMAGTSQTLTLCQNSSATSINSLLAISDTDAGQTETWSLYLSPLHGTAIVAYSTVSTGMPITPIGLSYTPAASYVGSDSFKVRITDGIASDSITIHVIINPLPNPGLVSGLTTLCVGTTITLTSGVTGGIWSSSTPSIATVGASSGVVSGVAVGTTIISYSVTNSCGTAVDTQATIVTLTPSAGVINGPTNVCAGSSVTLTDAMSGGTWSSSMPGVATINAASGIAGGVSVGTSTITYTVTSSCGTASTSRLITVDPAPNAGTITGLSNLCVGNTITLANATSGGGWSSSSGIVTVGGSSGIISGLTAGTTIISYAVTNSCGTAIDTQTITVNSLPGVGLITAASSSLCAGITVTLNNSVTGGTWNSSNTSIATVDNSSGFVNGLVAGSVTITYTTAPNSFGCINTAVFPLTIISSSSFAPVSTINQIKCNGDGNGSISMTVPTGVGPYQYSWSNGGSTSSIASLTAGTYSVVVEDLGTHCVDSQNFNLIMPSAIVITSTAKNDFCDLSKGSIDVSVIGGTPSYAFSWSNSATTEDIASLLSGSYIVTVTDANLCVSQQTIIVNEDSCNTIVIHDVITPNGDGVNDNWVIEGLSKYPQNTVGLFDKWGDAVFSATNYNNNFGGEGKDGKLLPDGTYFYLVKLNAENLTGDKNVFTGSFLIKR